MNMHFSMLINGRIVLVTITIREVQCPLAFICPGQCSALVVEVEMEVIG